MKKIHYLSLLLPLIFLTACSSSQSNSQANTDQAAPPAVVGNDRDAHGCIGSAGYSWCEPKQKCLRTWEEKCETEATSTDSALKVNESVTSEQLGLKVSFYSNPENRTSSKVDGNRIYFYWNGPSNATGYKSGQFLEGFTKAATSSFPSAIEDRFLRAVNKEKCSVKITEDTPDYQEAIIDYPDTPCADGSPAFTCNSCPANYSRTNGIAYFKYYKSQPDKYFYFSIGQYSLLGGVEGAKSSLEWFNNLEFVK